MSSKKSIQLSIRINIDNNNKGGFADTYNLIKRIDPKIHVYPAFVHAASCKSLTCIDNNMGKIQFYTHLFNESNIYLHEMTPNTILSSCMARCINSLMIGPEGELYKCWHHLGNDKMIVGNILDDKVVTNIDLFARIMKENDYLDKNKCMKCKFFPVCGGGCADLNIQNNTDSCSMFKHGIISFLDMKYSFLTSKF